MMMCKRAIRIESMHHRTVNNHPKSIIWLRFDAAWRQLKIAQTKAANRMPFPIKIQNQFGCRACRVIRAIKLCKFNSIRVICSRCECRMTADSKKFSNIFGCCSVFSLTLDLLFVNASDRVSNGTDSQSNYYKLIKFVRFVLGVRGEPSTSLLLNGHRHQIKANRLRVTHKIYRI